jgi:HEAT repeat protein
MSMTNTKTIRKLINDLNSSDVLKKRNAAQSLAEADERAIYPLIKALRDENYGVQDAAIRSLVSIGGDTVAYMVLPLLREDSYLRNTAMLILRNLGRASVSLLYPLLRDKDDDVRMFSIELLGEIKEDVLPEKIVSLIKDPNANVRAAAIKAIGDLRYREAGPDVINALGDEEWVCFAALETLGALRYESAVEPITGLLTSEFESIRYDALETLGLIGSRRSAEVLVSHIRTAGGQEKKAAIKSLVQIGITPSMSEVTGILKDMFESSEDWDEKLLAIKGLVDLNERSMIKAVIDAAGSLDRSLPEDEERLMTVTESLMGFGCAEEFVEFLSDTESRFRGRVISAEILGRLKCEQAVPVLVNMLGDTMRDLRRASIQALGYMESPDINNTLIDLLYDGDSFVRKTAVVILGRRRDKEAFELVLKRLDEEEYFDVIEEDVKALLMIDPDRMLSHLGEFNNSVREAIGRFSDNVDILIRLSGDEELKIKLSAIAGLGRLEGERAEERLKAAIREDEPQVRRTAVMAISGSSCCIEEIKSLLDDNDMWVRLHAVRALGESRDPDMLATIAEMLNDNDIPVVLAAVEAFGMIGGMKAMSELKSLLNHRDETVREAAGWALEKI